MKIMLNGKPKDIASAATVASLLEQLGLDRQQVVVERNAAIVARQSYAGEAIQDGDTIEIIHFVGGG